MRRAARARDRVWAVLGEDGRAVLLGRGTDPAEPEIAQAEQALVAQHIAGWLVVVEGDRWSRRSRPRCLPVRPLGCPIAPFEAAAIAFEARRQDTLAALLAAV